jgi:hypothetical protein
MYINEDNAAKRLGGQFAEFYDIETDQAPFDEDVARIEGEVNSLVGRRYQLPPAGAGLGLVIGLALDLFEERAWQRGGAGDTVPAKVTEKAAQARKLLEQISAGKATLADSQQASAPAGSAAAVAVVQIDTPLMTSKRLQEL